MNVRIERLLEAWDDMDNAAQRILTAQPWQMTEAADRLNNARLSMRKAVRGVSVEPQDAKAGRDAAAGDIAAAKRAQAEAFGKGLAVMEQAQRSEP